MDSDQAGRDPRFVSMTTRSGVIVGEELPEAIFGEAVDDRFALRVIEDCASPVFGFCR